MELIAREGYWLTQKVLEDEATRMFWSRLYPAVSLTEDDFIEWSDEQKAQWEQEHPVEVIEPIVDEEEPAVVEEPIEEQESTEE